MSWSGKIDKSDGQVSLMDHILQRTVAFHGNRQEPVSKWRRIPLGQPYQQFLIQRHQPSTYFLTASDET